MAGQTSGRIRRWGRSRSARVYNLSRPSSVSRPVWIRTLGPVLSMRRWRRRRIWLVWVGNIPRRILWWMFGPLGRRRRIWLVWGRSFTTTMPARLFPGTVALALSRPAFRFGVLDDLSFDAAPTRRRRLRFTMLPCFLLGTEALTTASLAFHLGSPEDLAVGAAPTLPSISTMPARFLLGTVQLTTPRPTFGLGRLDDTSIDAAPPERRWWWSARNDRLVGINHGTRLGGSAAGRQRCNMAVRVLLAYRLENQILAWQRRKVRD